MNEPVISVIVPTKNSEDTLRACLHSIRHQTYSKVEIIVVDNFSTDGTVAIAENYSDKVVIKGPERSTQRNYGVSIATGEYVVIIDSDMELTSSVLQEGVNKCILNEDVVGIIIPEISFGQGFWASCKRLERSFYLDEPGIEAARIFRRDIYIKAGGYDEQLISGEDWDLSTRIAKLGKIDRVTSIIRHNEGKLTLYKTLQKKFYYAKKIHKYITKNNGSTAFVSSNSGPFYRYKLFLSSPRKLLVNPVIGSGMLFLKTAEYMAGFCGYCVGYIERKR